MTRRWFARFGFSGTALSCIALAACSTVLGIEDLTPNADGSGGSSSGGRGGGSSSGGNAAAGSSNGGGEGGMAEASGGQTAAEGGADGAGGTDNPGGADGAGGSMTSRGGASSGGKGGAGGTGGAGAGGSTGTNAPVTGKVIDYLGRVVPGVTVTLGGVSKQTNAQGVFAFPAVPSEYDVSLLVKPVIDSVQGNYYWVYQGLTRRDPTLQVYRALEGQSGVVNTTISNGVFGGLNRTDVAFGSVDGSVTLEKRTSAVVERAFEWDGPGQTAGTAHGLRWTVDAAGLPVAFRGYKETPLAISSTAGTAQLVLDLADVMLNQGTLTGSVTPANAANGREHLVFLRFGSDAWINVVNEVATDTAFSYVVPSLGSGLLTVAAAESSGAGSYSIVHKDVAAAQTGVALVVPPAPTLVGPANNATAAIATATFQWATTAKVSVLHVEDNEQYNGVYVVTALQQLKLPTFTGGFALRSGAIHVWDVQTHGGLDSVDTAAGPNGFQDAFAAAGQRAVAEPAGPRRGGGSFSISQTRGFTSQ